MARKKTDLNIRRKNQNTKNTQKFIIYVEGRNTEPSYLNLLKRTNCTITPVPIKGHGIGSCVDFVKEVDAKYNTLSAKDKIKYKQKWIMFDYDGHNDFADGVKLARKNGFKVAFSSMCIEYWFLLHFINHDGSAIPLKGNSHSEAQIDLINQYIGNYNKNTEIKINQYNHDNSKNIEDDFFDLMFAIDPQNNCRRIENACKTAYLIHKNKKENGNEFSESVTTMYELMLELGVVKQDKDVFKLN